MRMCLPEVQMLSGLATEYYERYSEAKRDRGVVDFTDLEHMALSILSDSETRDMIRGRYRELIIDEYQDCNPLQESLIEGICYRKHHIAP